MRASFSRIGNSKGLIIPKPLIAQLDLADEVELTIERDALVIRKAQPAVREGWAADSRAIADAGDDVLAWPEFANDADADLKW